MAVVTPEEAEDFSWYDLGPHGVPELFSAAMDPASQVKCCWDYIRRVYGRRE